LNIGLDELATRHGKPLATFRRRWAQAINVPPTRYRLQARKLADYFRLDVGYFLL
jgi:hypothetical protein